MIEVVNKKGRNTEGAIFIGRPSPLGNPFKLIEAGGHYTRDQSVFQYRAWLRAKLGKANPVADEFERLFRIYAHDTGELKLLCFCTPLACHGDVVKELLEERLTGMLQSLMVPAFRGPLSFLSNYYQATTRVFGYPTVEHAFAAAKTTDPEMRARIKAARTPGQAKRLGRSVYLRPGWDDMRVDVMRRLLQEKFKYQYMREKLLFTRGFDLVEYNNWGDQFWGVSDGIGENHLGKLLMELRDSLS